jgi:hypothetical protein
MLSSFATSVVLLRFGNVILPSSRILDLHASSVVRPPMLTSSLPQPSSTIDIAPQDTRDPSIASPL